MNDYFTIFTDYFQTYCSKVKQNTRNRKKQNKTKILTFNGWMDTTLKPFWTWPIDLNTGSMGVN